MVMVSLYMTFASSQTFYFVGDEKWPIQIIPNVKVILCEDTIKTPIHLEKGDSLIKRLNLDNSMAFIYREGENSRTYEKYSDKDSNICIYPTYTGSRGEFLAPTGYIETTLKNIADTVKLKDLCREYDCVIDYRSQYHNTWFTLRMKPRRRMNPVKLANTLQENGLLYACPMFWQPDILQISYDTETTKQWGLYNPDTKVDISVSSAWNYATGRNIKIGVIDSGFDIEQEDLKQRISKSYDVETKSSPCKKIGEHGTRCAGIIAATRNNNKGIAGVAPDAMLLLARIPTGDHVNTTKIADAIDWCRKNGADIISTSIGFRSGDMHMQETIKAAVDSGRNGRGCIIVAAAGNIGSIDTTKTILYPAADPLVIAVGNINKDGLISRSSRYGKNMWVVAPGTNIMSPIPGNKYNDDASGTSLACPHVAGVAALILQRNPYLSWQQVRKIIADTAVKLPPLSEEEHWNEYYGYGLVNAYNAVTNTPRSTKF